MPKGSGKESKGTLRVMDANEPFFWMNGILATDLLEVTSDLSRLDGDGFWATSISFEGVATLARFGKVEHDQPFPESGEWQIIKSIWKSSLDREAFMHYVEEIRAEIARGTVYQVNACRVLTTPIGESSIAALFARLLIDNPAPYASFLRIPGLEIASASPELFLDRSGKQIKTSPIKGTQRGDSPEVFGEKDRSENIMIVDLMRNDFGRICDVGSVEVTDFLRTEEHPGIRHLVSDICGTLRDDISWQQITTALLPPGSVSGTPKGAALSIIAEHEPVKRDIYCGVFGWVEGDRSLLNVAIRTFWKRERTLSFGTGGGITWPSDPHLEWRETEMKANRLLGIAGGIDSDGWQYGTGLFETILIHQSKPLLLDRHLARVEESARKIGIDVPSRESIRTAIGYLARFETARLRLSFGNQFSLAISEYTHDRSAIRVEIVNVPGVAGIGEHKTFPYWENLDLQKRAKFEGFDEVLLVDLLGVVGEGATCNFLFKISDMWVTPPLASGVLPGVMRELALEKNLAVERVVMRSELESVESMVALSSLRICTPVSYLGNQKLTVGIETALLFDRLWSATQADSVG